MKSYGCLDGFRYIHILKFRVIILYLYNKCYKFKRNINILLHSIL